MGITVKQRRRRLNADRQRAERQRADTDQSESDCMSPTEEICYDPPDWFPTDSPGSTVTEHRVVVSSVGNQVPIPNSIFLDDTTMDQESHSGINWDEEEADDDDQAYVMLEVHKEVDLFLNYTEEEEEEEEALNQDQPAEEGEENSTVSHSTMNTDLGWNLLDGNNALGLDWDEHHNRFSQMTSNEVACYRIMSLLDAAGAPRYCYNKLMALLKQLTKKRSFDVRKAVTRETLMGKLGTCKTRPRIETGTVANQEVARFAFVDMLQDLLHGCCDQMHTILPPDEDKAIVPPGEDYELWHTSWMKKTFQSEKYQNFDEKKDVMLPIIIYMDKTGTDVNQRYSLEPIIFSLAAIPRANRESRNSWRHLGFVPQRKTTSMEDEGRTSNQVYHEILFFLLDGIREAQRNPPQVTIKLQNGDVVRRLAHLPLMLVMGDQLSQDTLCGRIKSNSGGAGRVHRSCMCSYLNVDNPYHICKPVDIDTINSLLNESTMTNEMMTNLVDTTAGNLNKTEKRKVMTYLSKKRNMFRSILRNPFGMHAITNGFDGIDFGSWIAGIHDATFDDFMHSVEAGMISYLTETVYGGLTKGENEEVEELTRWMLEKHRCSVSTDYPRMRLQTGFSRQTLMTSGERVGSLLALSLSLQHERIRSIIQAGHSRQIEKYVDIPTDMSDTPVMNDKKKKHPPENSEEKQKKKQEVSPPPPPEIYLKQHMHELDGDSVTHTLEQMIRHGFDTDMMDNLDPLQINQMIWHASEIFKNVEYPRHYPSRSIGQQGSIYADLEDADAEPDNASLKKACDALRERKPKDLKALLSPNRHLEVDGSTRKHLLRKPTKKGEGSSAAVLTTNMVTLNIFLEYVLCYHAFCKYGWSLPPFLQKHHENIAAGNSFVALYFQKLIYRGNATIDTRFPKMHSQCRMADNTIQLNSVMHCCCETGERLLKTEAKGISRTAQQRSDETFLTQTMLRLQDRCLLDSFSVYLHQTEGSTEEDECLNSQTGADHTGRNVPNFVYDVEEDRLIALDRFRREKKPNKESGILDRLILLQLTKNSSMTKRFYVFNEVVLRNNSRLRASPNYAKSGPWYDYANVSWATNEDEDSESTILLPAKCICFFQADNDEELKALIHSVDPESRGKITGRLDTLLTKNYKMEVDRTTRLPKTHIVPVASIDSPICCYPIVPKETVLDPESCGITYLLPRNHWSYMWMAMNQCLTTSNSTRKVGSRKGLNPMCDEKWLEEVRQTYLKYLEAKSREDLVARKSENNNKRKKK